jgi:glutaredoxin-related protein
MRVIFYSTHCPKCNVLKKKLDQKNVAYEEVNDVDVMTQKGFMQAPMLEVDDKVMNFSEATNWINTL